MFDKNQIRQIELGIKAGVDVSWYAKECFDWFQMGEIRWGLEAGVDVSIYAKPEIHWKEMSDTYCELLAEKNNV